MKVTKWFLDPMKQEEWLNHILAQGYYLTKKSALDKYTFQKTKEDFVIRLDYRDHFSAKDYNEYLILHEDMGWELVSGSRLTGIHIWQRIRSGNDVLNSDSFSRVQYCKRMMNYTGMMALLFLFYFYLGAPHLNKIFLTPGLWDMPREWFWKAFLFELPFALMRISFPVLLIIFIFFFSNSYYKFYKLKKEAESNLN
ncbi:DUF2812 domain-containing protein [Macrococcus equipercicus]|uniref:DUF2812 domain-containing protein n=1 Tax=Macrococcus equipercicus TaxID=69967 RepID=A0A9Q9BS33_9STAP|nr:DUF2812 domain-containing protein [Macrococcus equipercicus]UTH13119.1 DUF2812 domain-containing protein [Macrococcus equipercicus]